MFWGRGHGWGHRRGWGWRPYRPLGCGCFTLAPFILLIVLLVLCGMLGSCWSLPFRGGYGWY